MAEHLPETQALTERPALRVDPGAPSPRPRMERLAVEEPLQIRVAGEPVITTMRTPGEDEDLAVGFLFAEGIVSDASDLGSVAHCGRVGDPARVNVVDVLPGPGVVLDPAPLVRATRATIAAAACGVCGRQTVEDLAARVPVVVASEPLGAARVSGAIDALHVEQHGFRATGGMHAAGLFDAGGALLAFAEDVGRHNAVDKVVGALVRAGRIGRRAARRGAGPALLVVTGRVSFEIVQKCAVAGVPVLGAVSAPTSLAVDLAARAEIALCAFVRGGGMTLYGHAARVRAG